MLKVGISITLLEVSRLTNVALPVKVAEIIGQASNINQAKGVSISQIPPKVWIHYTD